MSETTILLTELEAAINYWRVQRPATGEECALSPEVNALADIYALMIVGHLHEIAAETLGRQRLQLLLAWRKAQQH